MARRKKNGKLIRPIASKKPQVAEKPQVEKKPISQKKRKKRESFLKLFYRNFLSTIKIAKNGFSKRVFVGLILTGLIALCFYIFVFKKNSYINGNVIFQGNTYFSYGNKQTPTNGEIRISPLCGCLFEHPHRGVEFFSKTFDLNTGYANDSTAGTQYYLTCPDQNMSYDPMYYFNAKIYFIDSSFYDYNYHNQIMSIISSPISYNANLSSLSSKKRIGIIDSICCDTVQILNILSFENSLHFELLGIYPISAFIPMKSSEISVIKENLDNYNSFSNYYIQEKFHKYSTTGFELPMLDILGPKIAIQCNPKTITINNDRIDVKKLNMKIKTCVILLDVGFQIRIAQNKVDKHFYNILDTCRVHWLTNMDEYDGAIQILPIPLNDSEFSELKYRVDTTGLVKSRARWIGQKLATTGWGLPRLSQFNGVYFYGQYLSNLKCDEAKGVCQLGDKSYYFDPSRKIELKDLQDFTFIDEPVITPISDYTTSNFSTKFKGNGKLFVDNEFIGEFIIDKKWFATLLILLSSLSSIITIILYFRDVSKVKNTNDKPSIE
jgi:hypothetical protein